MKLSKKAKKTPKIDSGEISTIIAQIKELHNQGNLSSLNACVLIARLVIDAKLSKDKRLISLYNDLGISPSEGQKRAKIGRQFKDIIKSGHVAAYSISHFKKMLNIEKKVLDIIFEIELKLTVEQLSVVSQNLNLFIKCDTEEKFLKMLSEITRNNSGKKPKKDKNNNAFKAEEQGAAKEDHDEMGDHQSDIEDDDIENDEGSTNSLPAGLGHSKPIPVTTKLKKVVEDLKTTKTRISQIKIDSKKSKKIKEIVIKIRKELDRIVEEL